MQNCLLITAKPDNAWPYRQPTIRTCLKGCLDWTHVAAYSRRVVVVCCCCTCACYTRGSRNKQGVDSSAPGPKRFCCRNIHKDCKLSFSNRGVSLQDKSHFLAPVLVADAQFPTPLPAATLLLSTESCVTMSTTATASATLPLFFSLSTQTLQPCPPCSPVASYWLHPAHPSPRCNVPTEQARGDIW